MRENNDAYAMPRVIRPSVLQRGQQGNAARRSDRRAARSGAPCHEMRWRAQRAYDDDRSDDIDARFAA